MSIKIVTPNEKIAPKSIEEIEAAIGKQLPADYKAFLLASNGGKPESNEFSVPNTKTGSGVRLFYGAMSKRQDNDLLHEHRAMFDRMPSGILPIGNDATGNYICLSVRNESYGKIFFWDHELEAEEGDPATFANLFLVGDSFDDFFAKLKKFDPSQIKLKPGQVKKVWVNPNFKPEF